MMRSHTMLPLVFAALVFACGDAGQGSARDGVADTTEVSDVAGELPLDVAPDALDASPDVSPEVADDAAADTAEPTYQVGYRETLLTYAPADGSADRTLRVVYWYPTLATTGAEVSYKGLVPAPGILGDAPPAGASLPVVLFSHGHGGFAEQSYFFAELLARHGFLVVAPDHTGNTFGATMTPDIYHRRPEDMSAILDHLEALPPEDPLAGLAGDRIAMTGHSFGGYTALAVGGGTWDVDGLLAECQTRATPPDGCTTLADDADIYRAGFLDPRVDAIIAMSPGLVAVFGPSGLSHIALPTMLMTADLDKTTPNETDGDPAWTQLAGSADNLRVDFATAGHFTFSDACSLPIVIGLDDGCGDGFIAPARAHEAIDAYALAFLRLHLLGDEAGRSLLSGETTVDPDVTLSHGGGR